MHTISWITALLIMYVNTITIMYTKILMVLLLIVMKMMAAICMYVFCWRSELWFSYFSTGITFICLESFRYANYCTKSFCLHRVPHRCIKKCCNRQQSLAQFKALPSIFKCTQLIPADVNLIFKMAPF